MKNIIDDGTTNEEWKRYWADLASHTEYIQILRIGFEKALRVIKTRVTEEDFKRIESALNSELSMAESCDAPNKPGYYRANND